MPIIVAVVGAVACLLAVILPLFLLIQPTQNRFDAAYQRYEAAYQDAQPSQLEAAKKALADNTAKAKQIQNDWHIKEVELMPPYDVSDRGKAWQQLSHELSEHLGPELQRWMDHSPGVVNMSSIAIQGPPNSPNGIDGKALYIPVNSNGSLSVEGDFRSLLQHVLKWNDFDRLVLIDQLKFEGNSPNMEATYSAHVIIFPQNSDKLGATNPHSGTGGAAAGGFGGYGGGGGFRGTMGAPRGPGGG